MDLESWILNLTLETPVPRSVPTDALFLEMGIWHIRFDIEFRQLTYRKRINDRDQNDPVYQLYQEMLKYSSQKIGPITSWTYAESTIFP